MRVAQIAAMAAGGLLLAAGSAQAQWVDYGAMIAQQQALMAQQQRQMQQMESNIVQQNLQNPAVAQAYQRHRAQGGSMTPQQYAYYYAATGGDTPQGRAAFAANERRNNAAEYQAWQGYQGAVQNRAQAQQQMRDGYFANQQEAGRNLQGNQTYVDTQTGRNVVLPYVQRGQMYQDPQTGRVYGMDMSGQYWASAPNGAWYPINPR